MTCVVGLVEGRTVYMGADAEVGSGYLRRTLAHPKVFRTGPLLIGTTGTLRSLLALRFGFTPPAHHPPDKDDFEWVATDLVEAIRERLEAIGYLRVKDGVGDVPTGVSWLIGYRGALYEVSSDLSTLAVADPYTAIGSGAEVAIGALFASGRAAGTPTSRVETALLAAATFCPGVAAPFVVEELAS